MRTRAMPSATDSRIDTSDVGSDSPVLVGDGSTGDMASDVDLGESHFLVEDRTCRSGPCR